MTVRKQLLLAAGCLMAVTALGRMIPIDLRAPTTGGKNRLMSQQGGQDGILRKASLDIGAADVGALELGDTLALTLFDDIAIDLVLKEKMPSPLGGEAFIAEASGYEGIKTAVVLRTDDGLTIDIQDYRNKKVYKVISTPADVKVQEIEVKGVGKCGCDALEPTDPSEVPMRAAMRLGASPADTCVDVLVAFDANAAVWAKDNGGGVTNFAQMAVQKMNVALSNTGLDSKFRFRLVGVSLLNVTASTVHDGLAAIKDKRTGWNAVRTARDAVGADIATTLIDTGSAYGTTGVGQSLSSGTAPSSFAESAYNVCAIRSVAISHTMTHECGHNMGAGHSNVQVSQPGPQLYTYSSGYYFNADGGSYCTIMAYDSENPNGENTTQVPYFSSPSYAYNGTTVGDSSHDNTKTLANTYAAAANWRAQKVAMSYDVNFTPSSGSLIYGSQSVTLSTGKSGTSIRYTLDGSKPTLSSPLYSSPITLTRTTTIKAISVTDGKASMPFEASYYSKDDIGYAIGIADLKWSMSVPGTSTLGVRTDKTIDGVALGAMVKSGDVCTFSTTVVGPATITWRSQWDGDYILHVLCDGGEVFSDFTSGYAYDWLYEPQFVDIPAGSHTVKFCLGASSGSGYYYYADMSDYWLDDFQIHYVQKPTFKPATSVYADAAVTFTGEQMVTLQAPDANCQIFYTLDGSDPYGKNATLYEGPFFINESKLVKAIAVQPGKGSSGIASGLYVERHAVRAGEWTLWGDGAYQAAKSGRMIAELCWNLSGCYWSQQLEPVITSDEFTTWAAANGIYLLAESWGNIEGTGSRFWELYAGSDLQSEMGGVGFPTFVFSNGSDSRLGVMLARNDGTHQVNGIYYRDTPESLIASFASVLGGGTPLAAPVPSVKDAGGKTYPFSVTLSNPNGSGTIYYTLDGTAPTRENGIRYTGAISIPSSGTTLKAVVWPSSASAVSGVPLAITYQSLSSVVGVDGVTWQNDATWPWAVARTSSGVKFSGVKKTDLTSGSVTSTIKASVKGPGLVKFKYTMVTRGGSDFEFKVNGSTVEESIYDYNKDVAYRIESTGMTEMTWTYVYYYIDDSDAYSCEFKDFEWIPFAPPKSVGGLTASQGSYDYGVVLRWKASANAKSYAIYRAESNSSSGATLIGTTEKCQYWDTSATPGWTYWYWVKAVNDYGESAFSSGVSGRRKGGSVPKFKVTFGKNGGSGGDDYVTATYGAAMPTPRTAPKLSGWTFAGYWDTLALDEKGTPKGKQYYDASMKSVRAWDKNSTATLWAKWTNKVTFGKNGGTGGDDYVTCTRGQPMPKRTMPTKSGYIFDGYWTTTGAGGVKYYNADGTSAHSWDKSGSVTLWAKWVKPVACRVTFGKNGGTGGDNYVTATTGKAMPTPRTAPKRTGWTFGGYWDTLACDAKGNPLGKQYYDSSMKSVRAWDRTSDATLWAKWTVRVKLGKNGGTGGDDYVTVIYNQPFPKRTMPTKSGYTFGGYWVSAGSRTGQCYNADGTGTSSMKWSTGGTPTIWALWTVKNSANVSTPRMPAYSNVQPAPAVVQQQVSVCNQGERLYTGTLDGGTFMLLVDAGGATAFLYAETAEGSVSAECNVISSGEDAIVVVTEDDEVFRLSPTL